MKASLYLTFILLSVFGLDAQAETTVAGHHPTFDKEYAYIDNLLVYQNKGRVPR